MARKTLNAYNAVQAGQGDPLVQHIPVMKTLQKSLRVIEEIATDLIDDWGPTDRLEEGVTTVTPDEEEGSFETLKSLIQEHGQIVPVLLRPSQKAQGRFEIVYGRRRLRACKELGRKVRANIQEMDDDTALMAKGLENAARRGLSFYEKALFAEEIEAQGHPAAKIGEVLGVTRSAAQHLLKVTRAVPRSIGVRIGSAPGAGRPKWHRIAEAFEGQKIAEEQAARLLDKMDHLTSDQRLDQLLKEITKREAQSRVSKVRTPMTGVKIKTGQGINLSVQKGPFADWLDQHLDEVLRKAHEDFKATGKEE